MPENTPPIAPPTCTVALDDLRRYMQAMLLAAGCDELNARVAASAFLNADVRGVGLQGLDHMPTLLDALKDGRVDGRARPRIRKQRPGGALVDGGRGPGQTAALFAVDHAVNRARESGSYSVGITNSFDLFMLGHYTERIAQAGMVGLGFSDAPPMVRPHGGTEARLGTNPMSIAAPTNTDPLVLDLATSALSASRVRQARYHRRSVPEAEGVDGRGQPTDDPESLRAGAIGPLAGHKGFGLGLCVALLSGSLTGSDTGSALRGVLRPGESPPVKGHLFVVIDPDLFADSREFRCAASAYLEEVKTSERLSADEGVRTPGERAAETRRRTLATGRVAVYRSVWQRMTTVAAGLGVDPPPAEDHA